MESRNKVPEDKDTVVDLFYAWINQRPGLDHHNYGRAGMAYDYRKIAKDKRRALTALAFMEAEPYDPEALASAMSSFSGRLQFEQDSLDLGDVVLEDFYWYLDYCTGQYWPTEYRLAAAVVLETYEHYVRRKNPNRYIKLPTNYARVTADDLARLNLSVGGWWFDDSREAKVYDITHTLTGWAGEPGWYFVQKERDGHGTWSYVPCFISEKTGEVHGFFDQDRKTRKGAAAVCQRMILEQRELAQELANI